MMSVVTAVVAAMAAFGLDRVTKDLAATDLPTSAPIEVIGQWVRLAHVHNTGTFFGMLPGSAPVLAFLALPALALIGWMYTRAAGGSRISLVVLGLVLGAGAGNTLDRASLGYVEDFVDIGLPGGPRFWTFNVSDTALTLGILLALLATLRAHRPAARPRSP